MYYVFAVVRCLLERKKVLYKQVSFYKKKKTTETKRKCNPFEEKTML